MGRNLKAFRELNVEQNIFTLTKTPKNGPYKMSECCVELEIRFLNLTNILLLVYHKGFPPPCPSEIQGIYYYLLHISNEMTGCKL